MSSGRLPPGKVPWDLVARHLGDQLPQEVLLGPAPGEDAALVRFGDETWAIASDPISFGAPDAGRLAVLVNANDVAVRGARPRFFLAVVLIAPGEAEPSRIGKVLDDVRTTCRDLDIALLGGHTEVTPGIDHSIVVGTMLGRVQKRPIQTSDLEPGDRIGLVGSAGLEGSAILLDRYRDQLETIHGRDAFADLERLLSEDWLLVAPAALAAAACSGVHALHDVTEGGVGEALYELGRASGLELDVDPDRIPVLAGTRRLCADLGLDPLGLIGSGALLIGCQEESASEVESRLQGNRLTWIGRAGRRGARPVPRFERDEVLKAGRLEGTRAVVFDLDGTLVVSPYDWAEIRVRLEIDSTSILDELYRCDPSGEGERWRILREAEAEATRRAEPSPGATELLAELREAGIAIAIVTNNSRQNASTMVERFHLPHDLLLTRDDGHWKPSAAPLLTALDRLGFELADSASVGDSSYDLHAARAANIPRICHVGRGRPPGPDRPDLHFSDLGGLRRGFTLALARSSP